MTKILAVFKLKTGDSVLLCDAQGEKDFSGEIITSIGTFGPGEYMIEEGTACFTDKAPCAIRLKTDKDCSKIKEIQMVRKAFKNG